MYTYYICITQTHRMAKKESGTWAKWFTVLVICHWRKPPSPAKAMLPPPTDNDREWLKRKIQNPVDIVWHTCSQKGSFYRNITLTWNARYMPIGPSGKVTAFRASSRYLYWLKSGLTLVKEKTFFDKYDTIHPKQTPGLLKICKLPVDPWRIHIWGIINFRKNFIFDK